MNTIYPKRKVHQGTEIKRLTKEEELKGFTEVVHREQERDFNLFQLRQLLVSWNYLTRICCGEEGNERIQELVEDSLDTTPIQKRKFYQILYQLKVSPNKECHIFTLERKIARPEKIVIESRENEILLVRTTLSTEKMEEFLSRNRELLSQLRLVGTIRQVKRKIEEKDEKIKKAKEEELEERELESPIGFPNQMERKKLLKGVSYNLYRQVAEPLFSEQLQVPYIVTIDKNGEISYRYQQEIKYEEKPYEYEPVKVALPSVLSTEDPMLSIIREKVDKRIPIAEEDKEEELKEIERVMTKYHPLEKLKELR